MKSNSYSSWIKVGYDQFAREGLEGIQVERLARIVQLNKSGYYHYFGKQDCYMNDVMKFHLTRVNQVALALKSTRQFDPEFIQLIIQNKTTFMVHMQLLRNRHDYFLSSCYKEGNEIIDQALLPVWSPFIGLPHNPELAMRYLDMVRDIFYSRITNACLNENYLRNFFQDARIFIQELISPNEKLQVA